MYNIVNNLYIALQRRMNDMEMIVGTDEGV